MTDETSPKEPLGRNELILSEEDRMNSVSTRERRTSRPKGHVLKSSAGRPAIDGEPREISLTVKVTRRLADATTYDRSVGKFNDRITRILEAVYFGGGAEDGINRRLKEIDGVIDGLKLEAAALETQRENVRQAQEDEKARKTAEDVLRGHIRAAAGAPGARPNWNAWLHPGRRDVRDVGWNRAREILREETGSTGQ